MNRNYGVAAERVEWTRGRWIEVGSSGTIVDPEVQIGPEVQIEDCSPPICPAQSNI